jgi:hypothetical protein
MGFQTVAARCCCLDRRDAILQHDVMRRLLELEARQPAPVHQCPGWSVIVAAVAQQKPDSC